MELLLESLNHFRPATGTLEQWNAAYVRVEDYLRAHRIHSRLHQSQLIQRILERAARRHAENPALEPSRYAAEETEREMDAWFGKLLGDSDRPHDRIAIDGRVAMLLCDGPQRWPYAFLDHQHVPEAFAKAMRERSFQAGPDLAVSAMVPRPIDLGPISEAAGETLERFERYPFLRMLALWAFFLVVLGGIFYITR
jgi:hypothetical protein